MMKITVKAYQPDYEGELNVSSLPQASIEYKSLIESNGLKVLCEESGEIRKGNSLIAKVDRSGFVYTPDAWPVCKLICTHKEALIKIKGT